MVDRQIDLSPHRELYPDRIPLQVPPQAETKEPQTIAEYSSNRFTVALSHRPHKTTPADRPPSPQRTQGIADRPNSSPIFT
jgi:hypothetical protein